MTARPMRVLVTGGAGFIGSHLVASLAARGDDVLVLDDLSSGRREHVPDGVELRVVDVRERAAVASVFERYAPTHVCHLAARASVKRSVDDPADDASVNVMGGLAVLDACRRSGVERVVVASTGGAIYGEVDEGQRADESWELCPHSPYAAAKAALEHYVRVYQGCYGLRGTVLRFANVYGPRQDPNGEAGVVAIFLARMLHGAPLQLFARRRAGDGGCVRDYIYVSDVVDACLRAIDGRCEGTFNVASGHPRTTRDVGDEISRALGSSPVVREVSPRPGDLERSVLDPSRLERTGWRPAVDFETGVGLTAAWFASVPAAA